MNNDFKQQVVLALINGFKDWSPKFESPDAAAEFLGIKTPENTKELIDAAAMCTAKMINKFADAIVKETGQ